MVDDPAPGAAGGRGQVLHAPPACRGGGGGAGWPPAWPVFPPDRHGGVTQEWSVASMAPIRRAGTRITIASGSTVTRFGSSTSAHTGKRPSYHRPPRAPRAVGAADDLGCDTLTVSRLDPHRRPGGVRVRSVRAEGVHSYAADASASWVCLSCIRAVTSSGPSKAAQKAWVTTVMVSSRCRSRSRRTSAWSSSDQPSDAGRFRERQMPGSLNPGCGCSESAVDAGQVSYRAGCGADQAEHVGVLPLVDVH